uniref:Putative kDa family member n=1 Tax=Amblyomma tuberculatum TaxID=48802 RepID=A0A6M2E226_9ACAR
MRTIQSVLLIAFMGAIVLPAVPGQQSQLITVKMRAGQCEHKGKRIPGGKAVDLAVPCESVYCTSLNRTHGQLRILQCAKVKAMSPCKIVSNKNGKFPECCPKIECGKTKSRL